MEILDFRFESPPLAMVPEPVLCGVVSSGNLEILINTGVDYKVCRITVRTSARGFGEIWQAVLGNFAQAHAVGGTSIAINDMGATPAVVTLRLTQALAEYRSDKL